MCAHVGSVAEVRTHLLLALENDSLHQGGEVAAKTVQEFDRDVSVFHHLEETAPTATDEVYILHRHVCQTMAVKQLEFAYDEKGYKPDAEITSMVDDRICGGGCTQAVEEMIGCEKTASAVKAVRKFRRPETAYHNVISSNLVGSRHKFEPLKVDAPLAHKTSRLPTEAFRPPREGVSMDFRSIASTASTPPWFSPSATNVNAPCADLPLLYECDRDWSFSKLKDVWLGDLFDSTHKFVFRRKLEKGKPEDHKWLYPLKHIFKSSVMCLPVRKEKASMNLFWFRFETDWTDPIYEPVTDLDIYEVIEIRWRSVLWQYKSMTASFFKSHDIGIRMFADALTTILPLASRKAFWRIGRVTLVDIAFYIRCPLSCESNLVAVLIDIIQKVLKIGIKETMIIIRQRLAFYSSCEQFGAQLLEVDEAINVLEYHDHEAVKQEKQHTAGIVEEEIDFNGKFREPWRK